MDAPNPGGRGQMKAKDAAKIAAECAAGPTPLVADMAPSGVAGGALGLIAAAGDAALGSAGGPAGMLVGGVVGLAIGLGGGYLGNQSNNAALAAKCTPAAKPPTP